MVKLRKVETTEMESSERKKVEVDKTFDGIVAAVETKPSRQFHRRLKEIWGQKEFIEVSLAQLESFTHFTNHAYSSA